MKKLEIVLFKVTFLRDNTLASTVFLLFIFVIPAWKLGMVPKSFFLEVAFRLGK